MSFWCKELLRLRDEQGYEYGDKLKFRDHRASKRNTFHPTPKIHVIQLSEDYLTLDQVHLHHNPLSCVISPFNLLKLAALVSNCLSTLRDTTSTTTLPYT